MLRLPLLLGATLLAGSIAQAASYTWTGTASTDWFNAKNWSPSYIPDGDDAAYINGKTVDVPRDTTVQGLYLDGGAKLQGAGNVTVSGKCSLKGGSLTGSGALNIAKGGLMELDSGGLLGGILGTVKSLV